MNTLFPKKTTFERVEKQHGSSFSVIAYSHPYFTAPLHIHPEYELILIEEGRGRSFVGDAVRQMEAGDFMLIGSNLPHLWLSDDEYYEDGTHLRSRSVYTQFDIDIFPGNLFNIPELSAVYSLLKASERGLLFKGEQLELCKDEFRALVHHEGFDKWHRFCCLLHRLATLCQHEQLTSAAFLPDKDWDKDTILTKVHLFINQHYQEEISLESIADFAGMNPSALCRYYKKHTGKKIFEYLSELRISYAIKLLVNRNINISQVAYNCGYNSLSHFNHQFKYITGRSPSDYVKNVLHTE